MGLGEICQLVSEACEENWTNRDQQMIDEDRGDRRVTKGS